MIFFSIQGDLNKKHETGTSKCWTIFQKKNLRGGKFNDESIQCGA